MSTKEFIKEFTNKFSLNYGLRWEYDSILVFRTTSPITPFCVIYIDKKNKLYMKREMVCGPNLDMIPNQLISEVKVFEFKSIPVIAFNFKRYCTINQKL